MNNKLAEIISKQQAGHQNDPVFMIGEQLKEMAEGDDKVTELLIQDLQTANMKLSDAAKELQKHSDKNRGKATCYCITPKVAEDILRKFYGLPERKDQKSSVNTAPAIDLSDFL
ncbi:MAG: hypothetical protein J6D52_00095 [Clostridia bacterium]|nr:hypothetical protein [Clostridia bacterium]